MIVDWQLAVLYARLDVTTREPTVTTELTGYLGDTPWSLWKKRYPLSAFGLSGAAPSPGELRVPDDLRAEVGYVVADQLPHETSLWIRLVPPYGYLGAVPWEQSLLDVVAVPIFRVPDRLPVAVDPGRRWTLAVGISAFPDADWPTPYLRGLVDALATGIRSDVEVDVFTDAATHGRLLRTGWDHPGWVHVHEPNEARGASSARVRRLMSSNYTSPDSPAPIDVTSPGRIWADWISTGLAGRAVRALHVALDAVWDGETPLLALSPEPSRPQEIEGSAFIAADDVRRLADAVGAATLSLGCPPGATGAAAMRVIADSIGQQRPGATIYSSIARDPRGEALARLHAYLAEPTGDWLPRDRSLFAYVQPEQVRPALAPAWPYPAPEPNRPASTDDLASYFADAGDVPSWVAASERYVGQQYADLARETPTGVEPSRFKSAYEEGAAEGLAQLQAIVAKHARPS